MAAGGQQQRPHTATADNRYGQYDSPVGQHAQRNYDPQSQGSNVGQPRRDALATNPSYAGQGPGGLTDGSQMDWEPPQQKNTNYNQNQ